MSSVAEVGERLFASFLQAIPLPDKPGPGKRKSGEKEIRQGVDAGLVRFYEAARAEREHYRLGIIGRARVAFDLQRRLLAAGYAPALVKQVVFAMLVAAFVSH